MRSVEQMSDAVRACCLLINRKQKDVLLGGFGEGVWYRSRMNRRSAVSHFSSPRTLIQWADIPRNATPEEIVRLLETELAIIAIKGER